MSSCAAPRRVAWLSSSWLRSQRRTGASAWLAKVQCASIAWARADMLWPLLLERTSSAGVALARGVGAMTGLQRDDPFDGAPRFRLRDVLAPGRRGARARLTERGTIAEPFEPARAVAH